MRAEKLTWRQGWKWKLGVSTVIFSLEALYILENFGGKKALVKVCWVKDDYFAERY